MSVKTKAAKRARGKSYECACGEEKLRITREHPADAFAGGWSYLVGECGGGVKLRFEGVRVVETRAVDVDEVKRVQSRPLVKVDPVARAVASLDDKSRRRLEQIVVEIRESIQSGMQQWLATGRLLAEAKRIFKKGDFGTWVEHNGMDRPHAYKLIQVWEAIQATPAGFSQTFVKIGQEKSILLARLPAVKRLEVLDDGVVINGGEPTPVDRVTYRQLNVYVRSIVGKSARGRKAKTRDAQPAERFGLPIALVEAFQASMKSLQTLKKHAREGWSDAQRPAVAKLWRSVNQLFYELQDDHHMAKLLEDV